MKVRLCFALAVALSACAVDDGVDHASDDPGDDDKTVVGDDDDDSSDTKTDDDDDTKTDDEKIDTAPTWTTIKAPTQCKLTAVWGATANDVWFNGERDTTDGPCLLRWNGSKITDVTDSFASDWSGEGGKIWGSAANDVWFLTEPGSSATTSHHWDGSKMTMYVVHGASAITGDGSGHLWASGLSGYNYRWSGKEWFWETGALAMNTRAMWSSGTSEFWAGGDVLNSDSGPVALAHNWGLVGNDAITTSVVGIWGSSAKDVWALQSVSDGIAHYDGKEWESVRFNTKKTQMKDISGTSASDVWAVGSGVWHWDGKAWTKNASTSMKAVYAIAPNDVWAISAADTIEHYH